jgi:hypothetical protein
LLPFFLVRAVSFFFFSCSLLAAKKKQGSTTVTTQGPSEVNGRRVREKTDPIRFFFDPS